MIRITYRLVLIGFILGAACTGKKNVDEKRTSKTPLAETATTIDKKKLIGSWLDPTASKLHFSLFQDGTARSDNMKTLLYQKWRLNETTLILTTKSIGNGTLSTEENDYEIKILTPEKMVLQNNNGHILEFRKKK